MDTSGSKASATAMESTISLMGAITVGNTGPEKTALGFMDLPTEIRLKIYGYLLLARTGLLPLNTKTADSALSPVVLSNLWYKSRRGMSFSTLGIPSHRKKAGNPWSFHPAILSTCSTIYEEARTVLYGENRFLFPDILVTGRSYDRAVHESVFLEQCENLFKYNEKDWWRSDGPFLLQNSPFARFLNKIGARNAASLKVVELMVNCKHSGNNTLTADLLMPHVPALKTLRVFVPYLYNEHCDIGDPRKVGIQNFCRTLADSVRGHSSFEIYDYKGNVFGVARDLEARPEYSMNAVPLSKEQKDLKESGTHSNSEERAS